MPNCKGKFTLSFSEWLHSNDSILHYANNMNTKALHIDIFYVCAILHAVLIVCVGVQCT